MRDTIFYHHKCRHKNTFIYAHSNLQIYFWLVCNPQCEKRRQVCILFFFLPNYQSISTSLLMCFCFKMDSENAVSLPHEDGRSSQYAARWLLHTVHNVKMSWLLLLNSYFNSRVPDENKHIFLKDSFGMTCALLWKQTSSVVAVLLLWSAETSSGDKLLFTN